MHESKAQPPGEPAAYPAALEAAWLAAATSRLRARSEDGVVARLEGFAGELSEIFTTGRFAGLAAYRGDEARWLAYGLYFFPQTFARMRLVLAECLGPGRWAPPPRPRILDLGAGTGAAGMAALSLPALADGQVEMVDLSPVALRLAEEIFAATAAARGPAATRRARTGDLRDPAAAAPERAHLVLAGYALNEALEGADNEAAAAWLRAALDRVEPGGLLVICEPALRACAERLEMLRDRVAAEGWGRIVGPCLHHAPCPLRREGRVWCHEVRDWPLPRLVQRLNRRLERGVHVLKFSFLAVAREPAGADTGGDARARLVARFTPEAGKIVARGCAADGRLYTYEILTRRLEREQLRRARDLERGLRVRWPALAPTGGGAARRAETLPEVES